VFGAGRRELGIEAALPVAELVGVDAVADLEPLGP
jgi:hypothetical protein